ncbi:MAG: fibronectin type III domain-containing protein, partial [Bacteroidales bacterium]|nr:fibronectin type III domain-containing protein [Bacteroidales bacterium]
VVQYDLLVDGNRWTFQIKVTNDNQVACIVEKLNRQKNTLRFAFGVKRGEERGLTGGTSDTDIKIIESEKDGWQITPAPSYYPSMNPALTNYKISIAPKTALVSTDPSYAKVTANVLVNDATKEAIQAADAVLAFVSAGAQPYIRHDNEGAEYKAGDLVAMQYPVVFHGKPTMNGNTFSFSGTGLEPGKAYYLFLCLGKKDGEAWNYETVTFGVSDKFQTLQITDPVSVSAGTPNGNKIPLTIGAAEGFATMIVKSSSASSIAPKGKLEVGDTYENWITGWGDPTLGGTGKIIAFLPEGATAYDLEMTPGEMAYLQIFSVVNQAAEDAAYSTGMAMVPVYLQADKLPLSYTFEEKDLILSQPRDAMPILPPGLSTGTVLPDDPEEMNKIITSAFAMAADDYRDNFYLQSSYYYDYEFDQETWEPIYTLDTRWPDVIMPAFSGVEKVQATFRTKYFTSAMGRGTTAYKPEAGDSIRIEYSLNGGEWKQAALFTSNNLPDIDYGAYPLTVDFRCAKTDVVRLRYSYRTTTVGVMTAITAYEFLEGRDCETPANLSLVADNTTDRQIQLTWTDNNVVTAGQYIVSYQKYVEPSTDNEEGGIAPWSMDESDTENDDATEDTDVWETLSVNTAGATLRGLEARTAYMVKVQAVCGAGDSSFTTNPSLLNTLSSMPYTESLASPFDWGTQSFTTPDGISAFQGIPGGELTEADLLDLNFMDRGSLPTNWNIWIAPGAMMYENTSSIAVANTAEAAWLTIPAVYVRKTGEFYPKTLKFRVNTFDYALLQGEGNNGIDLVDPNLRLYVMASTNGQFTWNDTVASFDHTALMAQPATAEENPAEDETVARGKELTVSMDKFEGPVHIAFYFHNPNKFVMPDQGGIGGLSLLADEAETAPAVEEPLFLEIFDLSFAYDEDPCFPIENLTAEPEQTEAVLSWEGEGAEYGIFYGPAEAEGYAHTIYQAAQNTDVQTLTLTGLTPNTAYKVAVVSYCTADDHEQGSVERTITFTTLRQLFSVTVVITPEEAGTVTGAASYFEGDNVTLTATANRGYKFTAWLDGETELSKEPTYKFQINGNVTYTAKFEELPAFTLTLTASPAEGGSVEGAAEDGYFEGDTVTIKATANEDYKFVAWLDGNDTLSKEAAYVFVMPGKDLAYTALFVSNVANEELLKADFNVGTQDGRLYVRNLKGITIKDIDVYGLTGNLINRFAPNSREDLVLPIDTRRAILFVRLNTEQGVAVYKVYMQ